MIGVKLEGRLGNQLFQYAFAYAGAKKLSTKFYLDKGIQNVIIDQYFEITEDLFQPLDKGIFSIRGYKNLFSFYLRKSFYRMIRFLLSQEDVVFFDEKPSKEEILKLENFKMFKGYFQSPEYFKDYKEQIIQQFSIKSEFVKAYNNLEFKVPPNFKNVVIHIRRADYISWGLELPVSYFKNAISLISAENNFYTFISDDPIFVEQEFSYLKYKYVSKASEIIDFQFLMNAEICIISNSTFSWWATYLNQKKTKVIAPNYWFKDKSVVESPCEIYLDDWVLVNID